jgi:hypothetical protein
VASRALKSRLRSVSRIAAILLLGALLPLGARAEGGGHSVGALPPHDASDPAAAAVSEATLLESERFWPYQAELVAAEAGLAPGTSGVVIRVEPSGHARLDFGRDGLHEVPIAKTDLVARANRVREGSLEKLAANFALAIGPRVLDPRAEPLRPLAFEDVAAARWFLCVIADPKAQEFRRLAKQLAPLREREGLMILLFAEPAPGDDALAATLRKLDWRVPFLFSHLSEPYARTLVDPDVARPALLLQTSEGRVLAGPGAPHEVLPQIESALAPR